MRKALAVLATLALCACQPKADDGTPATEPADAPAAALPPAPSATAFAGDLDLRGTEPFWSLQIRKASLRLVRPDHAALALPNPGPKTAGDSAAWTAQAGADALTARLRSGPCRDGMSDKTYPISAEVVVNGETLQGCAEPARP